MKNKSTKKLLLDKINEISSRYPTLSVVKIIQHRGSCLVCSNPNISIVIKDPYDIDFTAIVNLHNYIELQGDIYYIKGGSMNINHIKKLGNFLEEITSIF